MLFFRFTKYIDINLVNNYTVIVGGSIRNEQIYQSNH